MLKNKWPYWIRGALLFGLLLVPLFFVNGSNQFLFIPFFIVWTALGVNLLAPFFVNIAAPLIAIMGHPKFTGFLIVLIFYILIGAIAGWVYGKVKSGKNQSTL